MQRHAAATGGAVSIGLVVAALYLASLRAAGPPLHRTLFYPKLWFSTTLGDWLGWNEHQTYNEPFGLWLVFLAIAVGVSGVLLLSPLRRSMADTPLYGALVGLIAPWCVLIVAMTEVLPDTIIPRMLIVVVLFAAVVAIAKRYAARDLSRSAKGGLAAVALGMLTLCLAFTHRYLGQEAIPLMLASVGVSCVLIAWWVVEDAPRGA